MEEAREYAFVMGESDDSGSKLPVDVKVEIGAKAEIKGEIPSKSLGRAVEALTDVFRYWSSPRALKPQLIRLQQEEVALKIAEVARARIEMKGVTPIPVKAKLLVPIFERGSCEDLDDELMIERWGNLLASAAQDVPVQPRFVGILDELAGAQAELLDLVAFRNREDAEYPYVEFSDSPYDFAAHYIRKDMPEYALNRLNDRCQLDDLFDELVGKFISCGVLLDCLFLHVVGVVDGSFEYDSVHFLGGSRDSDFSILQSLGLLRREVIDFKVVPESIQQEVIDISIYYYHLTHLGVDFCKACCQPTVEELKQKPKTKSNSNK